ncbi:hypothetical protein MTR_2g012260 [Medicago truncatula]|uniref:Uncharacterized protein n=1 Tax=Medicago truncatula TaxID=3880 RepID=G7ILD4_MEDTR|nr:hypothetical protein MTR_2g012260 [Medicago truncatula]
MSYNNFLAFLWAIWKERNSKIFSDNVSSKDQLLDSIKLHSWWWLKTHISGFSFDFIIGGLCRLLV